MSQISMPMRILLAGAVVFLGAWFTVLRPAPPATSAGRGQAAEPAAGASAPPVTAVPAAALAKLPKGVAEALAARRVIVLGVIADGATPRRPLADDDRLVRSALDDVNRYDAKVHVETVPLRRLSAYGALVDDLGVNHTPSVVVIDRNLKATVLSGYADTVSINQAIADARLRAANGRA